MRKHAVLAAALAVCLMPVLWMLDSGRFVTTLGAIAWIVGLAFLAAAVVRTGAWALNRLH